MLLAILLLLSLIALSLPQVTQALDTACPRFVNCDTGNGGLGDQLEHYIFCLQRALALNAIVIMDKVSFNISVHNPQHYLEAAELLGVPLPGAVNISSSCKALETPDMYSCRGWCHNVANVPILTPALLALTRKSHAREKCSKKHPLPKSDGLNIVIHVRNGDICLHCHDVAYMKNILSIFSPIRTRIFFESEKHLPEFERAFPKAFFNHTKNILEAICLMANADVLVTTGSSFPAMVAAFVEGLVVFEEVRKEVATARHAPQHFFGKEDAVLLVNGIVQNFDTLERLLWKKVVNIMSTPSKG